MSETTHERVDELLANAASSLESLPDSSDDGLSAALDDDGDAADLRDAAAAADDLLESDASGVLEAIGLRELPDGSEAESIPEAIARGDAEQVAELRGLLKLAKLSDRWDERDGDGGEGDGLQEAVTELRETLAERSGEFDVDAPGETDVEGESDGQSEADEESDGDSGAGESDGDESAADTDGDAESDTDSDEGDGGSFEDQLRSAVDDALGGFGDEVREARDHFQRLQGEGDERADQEAAEAEANEDVADAETTDGSPGDAEPTDGNAVHDETTDADEAAADETADTESGRGGSSSRGSTMHSTMAPPPSKRLDMGRTGRLSTMPNRNARSHR